MHPKERGSAGGVLWKHTHSCDGRAPSSHHVPMHGCANLERVVVARRLRRASGAPRARRRRRGPRRALALAAGAQLCQLSNSGLLGGIGLVGRRGLWTIFVSFVAGGAPVLRGQSSGETGDGCAGGLRVHDAVPLCCAGVGKRWAATQRSRGHSANLLGEAPTPQHPHDRSTNTCAHTCHLLRSRGHASRASAPATAQLPTTIKAMAQPGSPPLPPPLSVPLAPPASGVSLLPASPAADALPPASASLLGVMLLPGSLLGSLGGALLPPLEDGGTGGSSPAPAGCTTTSGATDCRLPSAGNGMDGRADNSTRGSNAARGAREWQSVPGASAVPAALPRRWVLPAALPPPHVSCEPPQWPTLCHVPAGRSQPCELHTRHK